MPRPPDGGLGGVKFSLVIDIKITIKFLFITHFYNKVSTMAKNIRKNLIVSNIFVCFFVLWVYNQHKVIK